MELNIKDAFFLMTQVAIVTSVIITNRANIKYLEQQTREHKSWIEQLQKTVADLRVKVGI